MKMPALLSAAVAALLVSAAPAARAESLTLYCAADEVWCQLMARSFEEETGITVDMSRKSSGEIYAQVKAEAENPKGDIWWAGTGDPHLQAAEEGLTEEYVSPMRDAVAALGDQAGGGLRQPHRRRLFRRAWLRLQQGSAREEQAACSEHAGPT